MTATTEHPRPDLGRAPHGAIDLLERQLQGIATFTTARRATELAAEAAARSRETRMDTARTLEVVRRQHEALIARTDEQLRASGALLAGRGRRTALIGHRNEWFVGKLSAALQDGGCTVVARLDNGADVIGTAAAEQPDLVLVEDSLLMVSGDTVAQQLRTLCPHTVVAAQVAYGDRVQALLEAGASAVFTRRIPPVEVAEQLLERLAQR